MCTRAAASPCSSRMSPPDLQVLLVPPRGLQLLGQHCVPWALPLGLLKHPWGCLLLQVVLLLVLLVQGPGKPALWVLQAPRLGLEWAQVLLVVLILLGKPLAQFAP